MKPVFKELKPSVIQQIKINALLSEAPEYFLFPESIKIAGFISDMIVNQINEQFDVKENAYFTIKTDKTFLCRNGGKSNELLFRVDKMTLNDDNSIRVNSVKWARISRTQVKALFNN